MTIEQDPKLAAFFRDRKGRRNWHDPTTGKFAPAGFISMDLLRKLWSGDSKAATEFDKKVRDYRMKNRFVKEPGEAFRALIGIEPNDPQQRLYWKSGERRLQSLWPRLQRERHDAYIVTDKMPPGVTNPKLHNPHTKVYSTLDEAVADAESRGAANITPRKNLAITPEEAAARQLEIQQRLEGGDGPQIDPVFNRPNPLTERAPAARRLNVERLVADIGPGYYKNISGGELRREPDGSVVLPRPRQPDVAVRIALAPDGSYTVERLQRGKVVKRAVGLSSGDVGKAAYSAARSPQDLGLADPPGVQIERRQSLLDRARALLDTPSAMSRDDSAALDTLPNLRLAPVRNDRVDYKPTPEDVARDSDPAVAKARVEDIARRRRKAEAEVRQMLTDGEKLRQPQILEPDTRRRGEPPTSPEPITQDWEFDEATGKYVKKGLPYRGAERVREHMAAIRAYVATLPDPRTVPPEEREATATARIEELNGYDMLSGLLSDTGRSILATESLHDKLGPRGDRYSAERRRQHEALLDTMVEMIAASGVPRDRRALFIGGPPGAGKTTLLRNLSNPDPNSELARVLAASGLKFDVKMYEPMPNGEYGLDSSKLKGAVPGGQTHAAIGADIVKEWMAALGMGPDTGLMPLENASLIHGESQYLADQLEQRLLAEGFNVVHDGTMASASSTQDRLERLKRAGYDAPDAIMVQVPLSESEKSAVGRYLRGLDDPYGPRFVPGSRSKLDTAPDSEKPASLAVFDDMVASRQFRNGLLINNEGVSTAYKNPDFQSRVDAIVVNGRKISADMLVKSSAPPWQLSMSRNTTSGPDAKRRQTVMDRVREALRTPPAMTPEDQAALDTLPNLRISPVADMEVPVPAERPLDMRQLRQQMGNMNIAAISGGRVIENSDGSVTLPVGRGYSVRVSLAGNDTYTVERVFTRQPNPPKVKGRRIGVFADEVGQAAYEASNFRDDYPMDPPNTLQISPIGNTGISFNRPGLLVQRGYEPNPPSYDYNNLTGDALTTAIASETDEQLRSMVQSRSVSPDAREAARAELARRTPKKKSLLDRAREVLNPPVPDGEDAPRVRDEDPFAVLDTLPNLKIAPILETTPWPEMTTEERMQALSAMSDADLRRMLRSDRFDDATVSDIRALLEERTRLPVKPPVLRTVDPPLSFTADPNGMNGFASNLSGAMRQLLDSQSRPAGRAIMLVPSTDKDGRPDLRMMFMDLADRREGIDEVAVVDGVPVVFPAAARDQLSQLRFVKRARGEGYYTLPVGMDPSPTIEQRRNKQTLSNGPRLTTEIKGWDDRRVMERIGELDDWYRRSVERRSWFWSPETSSELLQREKNQLAIRAYERQKLVIEALGRGLDVPERPGDPGPSSPLVRRPGQTMADMEQAISQMSTDDLQRLIRTGNADTATLALARQMLNDREAADQGAA
ncbi:MAG: zeta toxin family protein [Microthrixaceae bacterium]